MNYYDVIDIENKPIFWWKASLEWGNCCAVTEAIVENPMPEEQPTAEDFIVRAMNESQTLLFWHLLPSIKSNARMLEVVPYLPATHFIAEYVNKRTGKRIISFVTNLQEEW